MSNLRVVIKIEADGETVLRGETLEYPPDEFTKLDDDATAELGRLLRVAENRYKNEI